MQPWATENIDHGTWVERHKCRATCYRLHVKEPPDETTVGSSWTEIFNMRTDRSLTVDVPYTSMVTHVLDHLTISSHLLVSVSVIARVDDRRGGHLEIESQPEHARLSNKELEPRLKPDSGEALLTI